MNRYTQTLSRLAGRLTILPFRIVAYLLHATGLERLYKPRLVRHVALMEINDELIGRLPHYCRTITGAQSDPINLILVGDERSIKAAFRRAHWHRANPASPLHVMYGLLTSLFKRSYRTGPFAPLYINIALQDLAFQRSKRRASFRERHHLRLWRTGLTLTTGDQIWVGAAGREDGMKLGLAIPFWSHALDPDIDAERDFVVRTLERHGSVQLKLAKLTPVVSRSKPCRTVFGSNYYTDGRAAVVEVRRAA